MIHGEEALNKLMEMGFNCQHCGKCCLQLGFSLQLTEDETMRWEESVDEVYSNFGYRYLEDFIDYIPEFGQADLWFHPNTGEELSKCPFLRKRKSNYNCLIYTLRPEACKYFPFDRNGELHSCAPDICPEVKRLSTSF